MTTYRTGTCTDLAAVVDLEAEVFGRSAWSAESVTGELAGVGDTRRVVVALEDDDDALVGYAVLMCAGQVADLHRVAVRAGHRRKGIAAGILRRLLDDARSRGCEQVLLEVGADNRAALALYRRFGFAEISRRLRYYPGDVAALVLALHLG